MNTTTNTAISIATETSFEILNYMEFELESILFEEFEQGLPNDILYGI